MLDRLWVKLRPELVRAAVLKMVFGPRVDECACVSFCVCVCVSVCVCVFVRRFVLVFLFCGPISSNIRSSFRWRRARRHKNLNEC